MHMSAKLVRRSCPIDLLRHVFKQRRVENCRSHSTGMTRSLGLYGFPSSTYTHSKIKHIKMKGHAYKIWGAIARSSPCHATPVDSQCVLHWLTATKPLSVFVENRIAEIRKIPNTTYCYVPTSQNPTDLATRACTVSQLKGEVRQKST